MLTLLAVIIGHIYPVLFKGKGGKGISTFIGGLIAFDYFDSAYPLRHFYCILFNI